MTKHLTMNTIIHAAFRRDMKRFDAALAVFSPGDKSRAAELSRAWGNFAFQLHHHHERDHDLVLVEAPKGARVGEQQQGEQQDRLHLLPSGARRA